MNEKIFEKEHKCMFYENRIFNQPLASWDVSKVENMNSMFYNSGQNPRPSWYKG